MERWIDQDQAQLDMTERAVTLVKSRYTRWREREDVIRVFGEALERVAEISPVSSGIDPKLMPLNSVRLQSTVDRYVNGHRSRRIQLRRK
jgi:hypothetical protein